MAEQIIPAELHTAARRLRWLRRNPPTSVGVKISDEHNAGMAHAYEYALRVLLDEFHVQGDHWHALMYGPETEYRKTSTNNESIHNFH